jgi:hypothetical protein
MKKLNHKQKRTLNYKKKVKKISNYYSKNKLSALKSYPLDVNAFFTMDGNEQGTGNFSYSISTGIYDSVYYQAYANLYQEFKIIYTEICIAARQINGSHPPEGYAMIIANEYMAVQYSEMPYLQGTTKIHGHGVTKFYFTSRGRNDDLNRWYNVISDKPNYELKCHFTTNIFPRATNPHYIVTVRSRLLFRRPIIKATTKDPQDENYRIIKNEGLSEIAQFKNYKLGEVNLKAVCKSFNALED